MPAKLTEFDAAEYITTRERARLYLEACAEEDPGDGTLVRAALHDIARARHTSAIDAGRTVAPPPCETIAHSPHENGSYSHLY